MPVVRSLGCTRPRHLPAPANHNLGQVPGFFWMTTMPLLQSPPKSLHRLPPRAEDAFRRVVGRRVTPGDYEGVHTTSDLVIAAAYAQGAAQKTDDEPVVIVLNTKGLEALADVDVTLEAATTLDDRGLRRNFGEYEDLDEACDAEAEGVLVDGCNPGDEWFGCYTEQLQATGICAAFDGDNDAFRQWADEGVYTVEHTTNLLNQRRYMHDFTERRMVEVLAIPFIFPFIVEDDPYSYEDEEVLGRVEEAGWDLVTIDDIFSMNIHVPTTRIAKGKARNGGDVQYHGTTLSAARSAFPDTPFSPYPYPVPEDIDPSGVEDFVE